MAQEHSLRKNQRGAALVIALLIMVAATVLAICLNFTSTTEVAISGNQRSYSEAFYDADGGLEFIKSHFLNNFSLFPSNVGDDRSMQNLGLGQEVFPVRIDINQTRIKLARSGSPPKGLGISAQYFKGNYYRVDSVVTDSGNVPQVQLEEEFALISPK
jgi:hypothetical protein